MFEFYFYPEWLRITVSMAAVSCMVLQAVSLIYGIYRHGFYRDRKCFQHILQAAILGESLFLISLIAQVQLNVIEGFFVQAGGRVFSYVIFCVITVASFAVFFYQKQPYALLSILFAGLTLPFMEPLTRSVFPVLYLAAILFYTLRAVHMFFLYRREIRMEISDISVKFALDMLHTGILFFERNGYVLLVNKQMQNLMISLTGLVWRNGEQFFAQICRGDYKNGCKKMDLNEKTVYSLPDQTVWFFKKTEIELGGRIYTQLSASDVTEQWNLVAELREQNRVLQMRNEDLKKTISNIWEICRQEEAMRMKSRLHDVLGQRIALLLRNLRENKEPDEKLLDYFAEELSLQLKEENTPDNMQQEIETLCRMMLEIGVTVHISGVFPSDKALSQLCMEIIMEAVTNAVRHGLAKEISVCMEQTKTAFLIRIANTGLLPEGKIFEGGGIQNMRQKLQKVGGTLCILTSQQFVLSVYIPEGE